MKGRPAVLFVLGVDVGPLFEQQPGQPVHVPLDGAEEEGLAVAVPCAGGDAAVEKPTCCLIVTAEKIRPGSQAENIRPNTFTEIIRPDTEAEILDQTQKPKI